MKRHFTKIGLFGLLTGFFFYSGNAPAQENTAELKGSIKDEKQAPIDFATVSLLNAADSSHIRSSYADEQGTYVLSQIKKGKYILAASMIGYKKTYLPIEVNGQQQIQVPEIILQAEAQSLAEVTVTAKTPMVERKDGALVVNVENTTLAAGNSALEVLQRSPGITLDKDDNISLMGKQGVTVLIDGKQTFLSAQQLANLLRSTDGNSLQSIELITNPGAKYDAAGSSGIINIKLKKNRLSGTNGTLTLSGGYGDHHKSNTSLTLNHKSGKFNLFGNYSYLDNKRQQDIGIDRIVGGGSDFTRFDQHSLFVNNRRGHSYRAGIDFNSSSRNTISLQVSGINNRNTDNNDNITNIGSFNRPLDSILDTQTTFGERYNTISFNVNNTFNIDTLGKKLVVEGDISRFDSKNNAQYNNYFYYPDESALKSPLFLRSIMPSIVDIQMAKADYTHPIGKKGKLETGVKISHVKTDNDMTFEELENQDWQNIPSRSNHFIYDEQVLAAYASYGQQFGKTDVKIGLRAENTISDGNSVTLQNRVKRDYLDFFPTLSVTQNLSENHQLGLSYSKRINRPNYGNLNPFQYFLDNYTSEQGNPYLTPEYTHSYELNYTLYKRYNLSGGYSRTTDVIAEMMIQDDETKSTYLTRENLAEQNNYFVNLNAPIAAGKVWSSNTNITGFYLGFKSNLPNGPLDYGQYALQLNSSHTLNITPTFRAEATLNYQSSLRYSLYHIGSQWALDAGLNKSLLNKRANLKLAISDIFNTRIQNVSTDYANLNVMIRQNNETRIARLTFTYNFGNTKIGGPRRESQSDEKSRVGK
ncbi:TonB-dependent receptor domain-containing protein [Olivibacter sitiensis]|uniref:TonB-dependent receptor domain-containing protein n=1 Tax=Olivibacter sitiensis TaxID=376470 RepID=UPI000415E792|nr:TonB-dependent receptor [Olivibacter sitiensis]